MKCLWKGLAKSLTCNFFSDNAPRMCSRSEQTPHWTWHGQPQTLLVILWLVYIVSGANNCQIVANFELALSGELTRAPSTAQQFAVLSLTLHLPPRKLWKVMHTTATSLAAKMTSAKCCWWKSTFIVRNTVFFSDGTCVWSKRLLALLWRTFRWKRGHRGPWTLRDTNSCTLLCSAICSSFPCIVSLHNYSGRSCTRQQPH